MSQERLLQEAGRWLAQGRDDLEAAEILFERGKYGQSCFYSQQSADKGVKAVRRALDEDSVGHSLTRLIRELPTGNPRQRLSGLIDQAMLLDRHYIPTRYPDALPDLTPTEAYGQKDARAALAAASDILGVVGQLISGVE